MKAWHFTGDTLRGGAAIPPIGEKLVHKEKVILCRSGLHASEEPYDALMHAPGSMLHRVELGGRIMAVKDKACASERTILATIDCTPVFQDYMLFCLRQMFLHIPQRQLPSGIVGYIASGNPALRMTAHREAYRVSGDDKYYRHYPTLGRGYVSQHMLDAIMSATATVNVHAVCHCRNEVLNAVYYSYRNYIQDANTSKMWPDSDMIAPVWMQNGSVLVEEMKKQQRVEFNRLVHIAFGIEEAHLTVGKKVDEI